MEQEFARILLVHRAKGYSLAFSLQRSGVRYAVYLAVLVTLPLALVSVDDRWIMAACLFAMGVCFGALCRDLAWLGRTKRSWPFTSKVTHWPTVEALAQREPSESRPERIEGQLTPKRLK